MSFHAKEGWYFERTEDGGVKVLAPGEEVVLDAGTWASAVASVCFLGETSATFQAAKALHSNEITGVELHKVLFPDA